jgi:hypothetical protein
LNIKDHLWAAHLRKRDKSIDEERDKRLFKWAYDRIMALEDALKPFADPGVRGPNDYKKANKAYYGKH